MRRVGTCLACLLVLLAACSSGGGKKHASPSTTSSTVAPSTSSSAPTSTTAGTTTSTTVACPGTGPTAPVSTPASQVSALLTGIAVTSGGCVDNVEFRYELRGVAPPSCKIDYQPGPFVQAGSGAPAPVAGKAFVVVRCFPAYIYDFETGADTYTGAKRNEETRSRHVREIVLTDADEGVLTWVIGLDAQRPFMVAAKGTPAKTLTITFS